MPVYFKGLECFVAASIAGRFKNSSGAVFKASEESAGVIDCDRVLFACLLVDAFFDKGLRHRRDAYDIAVNPAGAVDVVGKEIAGNTRTSRGCVKTPKGFSALRELFGHSPILEEVSAVVVDAAQVAAIDDLLSKGDGGKKTVVIPNEVGKAGGFNCFDHLDPLFPVEGEGLFAKDHLAIFDGGHGDVEVGVIGCADIDGIYVVSFDQFTPIGLGVGVAPFLREGFHFIFRAAADHLLDRNMFGIEKVIKLGVGIRMGAAHESVTNNANADRFFAHLCDRLEKGEEGARVIWRVAVAPIIAIGRR